MAITPTQWSHVLEIPESYTPSASTSGQSLLITETVIQKLSTADQNTFWSNVLNGGGDVRICENSDGSNQLPVEVVLLDNVAKTCKVWTRKATYDGTGTLYLFIGKTGETQPSVTDTYGRNNVWQDESYKQGDDGTTDVTGNTTITLVSGATQSGTVNGFDAVDVNGSAGSFGRFNSTTGGNWTGDLTVSAWLNLDSTSNSFAHVVGIRQRSSWEFSFRLEGSQPAMLIGSASPNSTGNLSTNTDHLLHATVSGSTISFYLDGAAIGTASVSGTRSNLSTSLTFGGISDSGAAGTSIDGRIAESRAINGTAISTAKVATEYQNQAANASFYGTPVLSTTSSSGLTISVSSIATSESFGSLVVSPQAVEIVAGGIASSEAFGALSLLAQAININISGIASQEDFGNPQVIADAIELILSGIASDEDFGALNVTLGGLIIRASGVESGEEFGKVNVRLPNLLQYVKSIVNSNYVKPIVKRVTND